MVDVSVQLPVGNLEDLESLLELGWSKGWTDGHPVLPPVREWVRRFLDYVEMEPGQVVGTIPERDRVVTAEKLAANAVMAGCKPEYMPVLVAAVEAICDPAFKFNHLASLGSPWPLLIVNGPIGGQLGISSQLYCFGPTSRASATITRAISLLLWNCAEARPDGIQRGIWGNTIRFGGGCVAENEETPWVPLHVQLGFERSESTVTALSVIPPSPIQCECDSLEPEVMAGVLAEGIARGTDFRKGISPVFVLPAFARAFASHGWSKDDVKRFVFDHCRCSVAELKRRGRWGVGAPEFQGFQGDPTSHQVQPGDEDESVYLYKNQEEYNRLNFRPSELARRNDLYIVVAGPDAGSFFAIFDHYSSSTDPVTKVVRVRRA